MSTLRPSSSILNNPANQNNTLPTFPKKKDYSVTPEQMKFNDVYIAELEKQWLSRGLASLPGLACTPVKWVKKYTKDWSGFWDSKTR